jgi:site-specific recombinase XerD
MNLVDLHSALADPIRQFVEYKRTLNRKYGPEAAALRLFDRYLCEYAVSGSDSIDSVLIERFLQSRPRSRPRSYNHLLGVLHRFFDWAVVQRLVASNPVKAARRRDTGKRIPYLFDLSDARHLLEAVSKLSDRPRAPIGRRPTR